jgi:hypothetical protein
MWRLYQRCELEGPQLLMFQQTRPIEELYDTETDPFEIHNLASDPEYAPVVERMADALEAWREQVGDWGEVPESEMVRGWYPGGERPQTAAPLFVPINYETHGQTGAPEGGVFKGPLLLQLHCATQGASIGYTYEEGDDCHWSLYTGAIPMPAGATTVRAKAVRIGYTESAESKATFTVDMSD